VMINVIFLFIIVYVLSYISFTVVIIALYIYFQLIHSASRIFSTEGKLKKMGFMTLI